MEQVNPAVSADHPSAIRVLRPIPWHVPDEPRPFPVDPLFDLVSTNGPRMVRYGSACRSHGEVASLALRLGVDRQQIYRWSHQGIGVYVADAIAIRLGRHPSLIWSDWFSYASGEWDELSPATVGVAA